jgi:hypothetical protein
MIDGSMVKLTRLLALFIDESIILYAVVIVGIKMKLVFNFLCLLTALI